MWQPTPPKALLALSGGKDSLSALYLLKEELKVQPLAVLYDNGFIPEQVVTQARRACDELDVELILLQTSEAEAQELRTLVNQVGLDRPAPCDACGHSLLARAEDIMEARKIDWLVLGTNYFAAWTERPFAVCTRHTRGARRIRQINLPFALSLRAEQVEQNLGRLGVEAVDLPGITSNCRVPGLVQKHLAPTLGHVPELEELALEIIVGHHDRQTALALLESCR